MLKWLRFLWVTCFVDVNFRVQKWKLRSFYINKINKIQNSLLAMSINNLVGKIICNYKIKYFWRSYRKIAGKQAQSAGSSCSSISNLPKLSSYTQKVPLSCYLTNIYLCLLTEKLSLQCLFCFWHHSFRSRISCYMFNKLRFRWLNQLD